MGDDGGCCGAEQRLSQVLHAHVLEADPDDVLAGKSFTIRQLQALHEERGGVKFHKDLFRRKALATGQLQPTGESYVVDKGRPAALYRKVSA